MRESFEDPEFILHACICDNDIPKLRQLSSTCSADELDYYKGSDFGTPLQVAVLCDNPVAVGVLLDAGADPVAEISGVEPPTSALKVAIETGNRDIFQCLWNHAPDRNIAIRYPIAKLLSEAASYGQASIVEDLLNWHNDWSESAKKFALGNAAANWEIEVVNLFLSRFEYSQDTIKGALYSAIRPKSRFCNRESCGGVDYLHQQQVITRLIDAGADPNSNPGEHIIIQAASYIDLAGCLKILLEKGADPNGRGYNEETVLHHLASPIPVKQGPETRIHETGIRLLLSYGASVIQQDKFGITPLHHAAFGSNIHIFTLYLNGLLDENQDDISAALEEKNGETLLHWAAAGGKVDILHHLLTRGMAINSITSNGWTPLMCALAPFTAPSKNAHQSIQAAGLLINHGADPLVSTAEGWTALHCLSLYPDNDTVGEIAQFTKKLIDMGAPIEARAPMLNYRSPRKRLQVPYYDIGLWGSRVQEAIQLAITKPEMIGRGRTPLHWAAYHGAVSVATTLLAFGADALMEDEQGNTAATLTASSPLLREEPDIREEILQVLTKKQSQSQG